MNRSDDLARPASGLLGSEKRLGTAIGLVFLIIPLAIGLMWGPYINDRAYLAFSHARNLAAGRGLTYNLPTTGAAEGCAPLYVLALWLLAELGLSLPQAGLALSVLGWGAAGMAIYAAGRAMRRPLAAVASAALLACNPLLLSTLGSEISWTVALAWVAIAASMRRRWRVQVVALALMVCVHCGWITLATAALLLALQWAETRRFPLWPGLLLAAAVLGWMAARSIVAPFSPLGPGRTDFGWQFRQLLGESELYWLFLPLFLCGIVAELPTARRILWSGALWGVISALDRGGGATVVAATVVLFLVGLGIEWLVWRVNPRPTGRFDRWVLVASLALVAALPLGVAHLSSLLRRFEFRPAVRQALEQQAAEWLRVHSEPTATVLGTWQVGYLADRAVIPWDGSSSEPVELAALLQPLTEHPPDYCVSFGSIGWDHVARTTWFQEGYQPVQRIRSAYDVTSPLIIWERHTGPFDLGERQSLSVRLPCQVELIGYQYGPERIEPGDELHVTLFLQATQPVTDSFRAVVRLISPHDGLERARQETVVPHSVPVDWWQPGQVIAERLVLTHTSLLTTGAYHLSAAMLARGSEGFAPLYQGADASPVDRIGLGYVGVPWRGEAYLSKRLDANLGEQIELVGFEAPDNLSPGAEFDVLLYWEAQRPPDEDYVVFVHLLDAAGQVASSHDGPPMGGRYPSSAWLPGELVPDRHRVALDPAVPVGTYRLQVGMYRWPSLERLTVWDWEGVEQADRVLFLQSVEVR